MRFVNLILSGVMLVMAGCATRYDAPKIVAPIRASVAKAQVKVASAQSHIKSVSEAAAELEAKLPPSPALLSLAKRVRSEAAAADKDLGDVTVELHTAQTVVIPKLEGTIGKLSTEHAILNRRYGKLKFGLCTLAAAGALFLLLKFKSILAFAGPWAWVAFAVGPLAVFALFWKLIDWVL